MAFVGVYATTQVQQSSAYSQAESKRRKYHGFKLFRRYDVFLESNIY